MPQIDGLPLRIQQQSGRADPGGLAHARVPAKHPRRDTAPGDEVTRGQIGGHFGFKPIRSVASTTGNDDLVARIQLGTPAQVFLQPGVLADHFDAGKNKISGSGPCGSQQPFDIGKIDAPRREALAGPGNAFLGKTCILHIQPIRISGQPLPQKA